MSDTKANEQGGVAGNGVGCDALLNAEWKPFETAPKDGTTFRLRQGRLAFTHGFYRGIELVHVEYQHTNRPTHWAPSI